MKCIEEYDIMEYYLIDIMFLLFNFYFILFFIVFIFIIEIKNKFIIILFID